jgi:hypothetical protein
MGALETLRAGYMPVESIWTRCKGRIYFIGCTETLRLKIGFTNRSVYDRLAALQTGSPTRLVLLGYIPGTFESEQNTHARFAAERIRGEWFRISPRLFAHLNFVAYFNDGEGCDNHTILRFGRRALEAAANSKTATIGRV